MPSIIGAAMRLITSLPVSLPQNSGSRPAMAIVNATLP